MYRFAFFTGMFFLCVLLFFPLNTQASNNNAGLISHQAIYTLELSKNHNPTKLSDIRGKMHYRFVSSCDGWITDQQFQMEFLQPDDVPLRTKSAFFGNEAFDGSRYIFAYENIINDQVTDKIVGQVNRGGGNQKPYLYLQFPETSIETLKQDDIVFPVQHMLLLAKKAHDGENIHHASIFDGSFAREPIAVNAVIGHEVKDNKSAVQKVFKNHMDVLDAKGWSVSYAYYKSEDQGEAAPPDYESEAHILENGIITGMLIKYPDFVIQGRLQSFEPLEEPVCE